MATYLALFRGINVGGRNKLPMASLKALMGELGAEGVRTVLQSGNAAFELAASRRSPFVPALRAAIGRDFGFEPQVLLLSAADLAKAIAGNPYPSADAVPKAVHVGFLESAPKKPDTAGLDALKTTTESWQLAGRVFYLHTPDGFGRSKLAAAAERRLGVPMTARNWATVGKLRTLAKG